MTFRKLYRTITIWEIAYLLIKFNSKEKQKMKLGIKKTLSWVLSLIMLFSMIPFSALAEDENGTEPGTPAVETTTPEENGGDQPQGNGSGSQTGTEDPVTPTDPDVNEQGGENGDNSGNTTDPNNNSGDDSGDPIDPNTNTDNNGETVDPNNGGDNSGDVIDPNNNSGDDNGDTTDPNNNGENGDTTDPNGEGGDDPVVPNGTEPGEDNGENETPANVTLEGEYAGVSVTVENVPAGTELTLKGASGYEEALSEKEEAYSVLFGIDIGLSVELEAPVKVTLKGEKFAEMDPEAKLYHINHKNEAEAVGYGYDDKELTVTFSAKEFSPYILIKAEAAENTDPDEPVVGGGDEPIVNGGDEPVVNGGDDPIVNGGEEPKEETVTVTVKAVFEEDDNADENAEEVKPESITVRLVKGEEAEGEPVELNSENEWTYVFEGLEEGEYTVTAEAPEGYEVVIIGSIEEGYILTIEKAYTALRVGENPTRADNEEYTVKLNDDFPLDTDAYAGKPFEWIGGATFEVYDSNGDVVIDEEIRSRYDVRIINVTSSDTDFAWDMGESYILSPVNDVIYTVEFAIFLASADPRVDDPVTEVYVRHVKTYNSAEILDLLDSDDQYVTRAWIDPTTYTTGFAPWDSNNEPGNDQSPTNNIIRSFDSIHYEINFQTKSYSENYYKEGYVGFLILLADENGNPLNPDGREAYVVKDSLSWMKTDSGNSKLNRKIGKRDFTVNGVTQTFSYVQGYLHLIADDTADNVMPVASSSVEFDINAGAMVNGSTIKPLIYIWCQHNDFGDTNNDGIIDVVDPSHVCANESTHSEASNGGKELVQIQAPVVIVSAAPKYNIQLKTYNTDSNTWGISGVLNTYDFTTGNSLALDKEAGSIYGRGYGMGITVQLYNSSSDKNLKGIELPVGDIELEISFAGNFAANSPAGTVYHMDYNGAERGFAPLVWSYEGNTYGGSQRDGRSISMFTTEGFPRYVAPYNKKSADEALSNGSTMGTASCYNGGTWQAERLDGDTIKFTVKDYIINSSWFPAQNGLKLDRQSANIYWDPRLGIENSCHIGCFSAAELWIIIPLVSPDGEKLEDHKSMGGVAYGSGTETLIVTDAALSATSASGINVGYRDANGNYYVGPGTPSDGYTKVTDLSNQEKKTDDKLSFTAETYVWKAGTFDAAVRYSNNSSSLHWIYDTSCIASENKVGPAQSTGQDVAELKQTIALWATSTVGVGKNNDPINASYGVNNLILFDNAGVELLPANRYASSAYQKNKFLYAAKKDGTGWNHYGLKPDSTDENGTKWYYDESSGTITSTKPSGTAYLAYDYEQSTSTENDLFFYESYEELTAAGAVCVGLLYESRSLTKSTSSRASNFKNFIKVKADAIMGQVYQIDMKCFAWTARTYSNYGLVEDTDSYICSRLDIQNNPDSISTAMLELFNHPTYRSNTSKYYTKATYDEEGIYTGGHSPNGTKRGDSVFIIPFRPEIYKYVLQVKEDGKTKEVYNLDENQNIVDFRLTARTYKKVKNESDFLSTTTLIITDTLPKGVTYNEDAMLGGTYTKSSKAGYHGSWSGGVLPGGTITVNLENGRTADIEFEAPQVTTNASGVTTLKFVFANFPVGADPIDIFYSVTIDNSATNGQAYKNIAVVDTDDVHMIQSTAYHTYSEVNFSVIRTFTISLSKLTDKSFVDIKAEIGYTMAWQNVGNNDVNNAPMMDILPYNGDDNGSSFSGTYVLKSVKLTNNNGTKTSPIKDYTGLRVFYTTDTAVRTIDVSLWKDDSIQAGTVTDLDGNTFNCRWAEAVVNADGTVTGFDENATAFCILGTLKSKKMIEAACVIDPDNNEPGDKYVNAISIRGSITIARGIVLNRILSGLAWYDENFDGARQANEKKLAGITVTLVGKDDFLAATGGKKGGAAAKSSSVATGLTPVINLRGESCTTVTGTDGKYEFAYLPAGDFVVVFTDGETLLSDFFMSPLEADTAREVNNSNAILVAADADGHVDYGYININMPGAADITASPYMIRNEDIGLVKAINVYADKKWINAMAETDPPAGAHITFTLNGGGKTYVIGLDGTADTPLEENEVGAFESEPWHATFQNLPKYEVNNSGKAIEIQYKLTESVKWPGFEESYSDNANALVEDSLGTVTNKEETTEISAKKEWKNLNGTTKYPDGATVTFTLIADNNETDHKVKLDGTEDTPVPTVTGAYESAAWVASFVNLPKYKIVDGEAVEIVYTIKETVKYPGYEPDTEEVGDSETITNEEVPTQISAKKEWKNLDGTAIPPKDATVTFTLIADDEETEYEVVLTGTVGTEPDVTGGYESEAWVASFVNLPKYKKGTTTEIQYKVKETVTFEGYAPSTTEAVRDGETITNEQVPTEVWAKKEWKNADGTSTPPEGAIVTFTLMANGEETEHNVKLTGTAGQAPEGTGGYESEPWIAKFVGLPKVDYKTGKQVDYTVKETVMYPGYQLKNEEPVGNGGTITNVEITTQFSVNKEWLNADGSDTPPVGAKVKFAAFADGVETTYVVVLDGKAEPFDILFPGGIENEAWVGTFKNLPKYRKGTTDEIEYTVKETEYFPGYVPENDTAEPDGTIKNVQETTGIKAVKAWNNADGTAVAPEGATITFVTYGAYNNFEGVTDEYEVTLDGTAEADAPTASGGYESEAWVASFVNLPKYAYISKLNKFTGKVEYYQYEIMYYVYEKKNYPGYQMQPDDDVEVEDGGTITNKEIETEISARKEWLNADGTTTPPAGATVTFTLYANGSETVHKVELTGSVGAEPAVTGAYESAEWIASFVHLPKYEKGTTSEIKYTVKETVTYTGYEPDKEEVGDNGVIVNEQIKTEASVKKIWNDDNDRDGIRPPVLKVKLSNGTVVELNEENGWEAKV